MGRIYQELGQEIAKLAYEIYEKSGRVEGRDFDNWLEAERIVMARYTGQKTPEGEPFGSLPPVSAAEVLEEELEAEAAAEVIEAVPAGEPPVEEVEPWPLPGKKKAAPKKAAAAKGAVKKQSAAAGAKKETAAAATEKKAGGGTKKK